MNFFDDKTLKKILYTFVAVLLVAIIVFVAIYIWYDNQLSSQSESFSLANEYEKNQETLNQIKEASSTEDKNISNVENINNSVDNTNQKVVVSKSDDKNNNVKNIEKSKVENTVENKVEKPKKVEEKKVLKFQAPVEGEIIKDYANETLIYSKTLDEWTTHLGIDIAGKKTAIVKAAEDGVVESIKNDPRYGLTITISHIDGFKTVYSNLLTTEFVTEGKNVKKGDTIATIGESASFEILDESHLHFEMYKDEASVNPTIYLK